MAPLHCAHALILREQLQLLSILCIQLTLNVRHTLPGDLVLSVLSTGIWTYSNCSDSEPWRLQGGPASHEAPVKISEQPSQPTAPQGRALAELLPRRLHEHSALPKHECAQISLIQSLLCPDHIPFQLRRLRRQLRWIDKALKREIVEAGEDLPISIHHKGLRLLPIRQAG